MPLPLSLPAVCGVPSGAFLDAEPLPWAFRVVFVGRSARAMGSVRLRPHHDECMQIRPSEHRESRHLVMAHRTILTSIWTSVLAALVALLSCFGLAGKAAPASAPAPSAAGAAATAVRRPAVVARRTWRAMMRGGSLPPTIKQRIRAEAHGKTPSVRRSTTADAMGAGPGTAARTTAPVVAPAAPVAVPAAATAGAAREALGLAA